MGPPKQKMTPTAVNDRILQVFLDRIIAWITESDPDQDIINNYLDYLGEDDGVIGGDYTFATQTGVTVLGAGRVRYRLNGIEYDASVAGNIALEDSGDVTQSKWGGWRILINAAGTITTLDAKGSGVMAFTAAEDALLSQAQRANTADTVVIGYCTLVDTNEAFQIGSHNTNRANVTMVFYETRLPAKKAAGLTAALGASIAIGSTATKYSIGTRDYIVNGLAVTQDAAETDKTFDDNDTITADKYGGWVIVTNLANSATYALAANGISDAVSAMAYNTQALLETALDEVCDRLPPMFCPVGTIKIVNATGTFTANTTNLTDSSVATTFTDFTVGTWDRTAKTGQDSQKLNTPTLPSAIAAAIPSKSLL